MISILLTTLIVSNVPDYYLLVSDKANLLNSGNSLAKTLQEAGAAWEANENGIWGWPTAEDKKKDALIVIGGEDFSNVRLLLDSGYTVWGRRKNCSERTCCREPFGYLSYLADDTLPVKPSRASLTFLHGHLDSWHQDRDLKTLIEESIVCTSQTGRYSALSWRYQISIPSWIKQNKFIENWKSSSIEEIMPAPSNFNSFLGAQFTITEGLLRLQPISFYKSLLNAISPKEELLPIGRYCELDGFDMEFAWSWIFGEGIQSDLLNSDTYPEDICLNLKLKANITKPLSRWGLTNRQFYSDSEGLWSFPKSSESEKRVMIVFGADPTETSTEKLIKSIFSSPLGSTFGVWIRQPTYLCPYGKMNAKQSIGAMPCSFTEGYSRFMHHYGVRDVNKAEDGNLESDVFVFLSGSEHMTAEDVLNAATKSNQRNGYYPAGVMPRPHSHPTTVIPWPEESTLQLPGQGFATSDFAVPVMSVYNINIIKIGYVRELTTPLILLEPEYLEFYWHHVLGEQNLLTSDTTNPSDSLQVLFKNPVVNTKRDSELHKSWFVWMSIISIERVCILFSLSLVFLYHWSHRAT